MFQVLLVSWEFSASVSSVTTEIFLEYVIFLWLSCDIFSRARYGLEECPQKVHMWKIGPPRGTTGRCSGPSETSEGTVGVKCLPLCVSWLEMYAFSLTYSLNDVPLSPEVQSMGPPILDLKNFQNYDLNKSFIHKYVSQVFHWSKMKLNNTECFWPFSLAGKAMHLS
jgi:hypothetical protein